MSDVGRDAERRRRLDRVTDEDYLSELDQRSVAEVRAMREDCRAEEARLSYSRRVVQGQLDIVRAERQRRAEGGDPTEGGLLGSLAAILADEPAPGERQSRAAPVFAPDEQTYGARQHDASADDAVVGRVPDLGDVELADLEQRLVAKEAHVSRLRRTVLRHLDALSEEMVRRYREGGADVDDVVASVVRTEGE